MHLRLLAILTLSACALAAADGDAAPHGQQPLPPVPLESADGITEFPLASAGHRPQAIAVGPDGNLWVTEVLKHTILRVTPQGLITEFPVPGAAVGVLQGIAAGADGRLWFTSREENRIRRVTVAGEFDAGFAVPSQATDKNTVTTGSWPRIIVRGGDDRLWFSEMAANRIASITPAGVIREYPIPTADSHPYGVAWGPDGGVWFAETTGNRIGRLDPQTGAVSEFPIPTADSYTREIAVGADGNLWFAENKGNRIGRITPAGVISEFPIPTAEAHPVGIAAGPDGNLWFCEFKAGRIGSITPQGAIRELAFSTPQAQPFCLCAGPDGNMWVALQANAIARVRVGAGR